MNESVTNYLEQVVIPLRLSCVTPSGYPAVLSLWYLYRDGHIYCATQAQAKTVSYLEHEPRCAFEIAADAPPYCGVRGQGIATIDSKLGPSVLEELLLRYLGDLDAPLARRLLMNSATEVAIVIKPERVFQWNYTRRMQRATETNGGPKICP